MKKHTVVWDWNGTLLNDVDLCIESINHVLAQQQMPVLKNKDAYQRVFQFPIIAYYQTLGFDFEKRSFADLAQDYMEYYQPRSLSCPLHEGVLEILHDFQERGYRQVLISASKIDFLEEQLKQYPIRSYFEDVIGLDNFHAHSKAQIAKEYVSEKQEQFASITFFGDSVHDYEVAHGANANCILIANGHEHKEKLLTTGCEVIDDLQDLHHFSLD